MERNIYKVHISLDWRYISYLRNKLVGLKADVRIRVSRNAGYTLEKIP